MSMNPKVVADQCAAEFEAGRRSRDAEVERLVEALREAQFTIYRMSDGPHKADWGNMLDQIDALLREYTPKERRDE